MLKKYPEARVACETMVSTNRTIIAGEYRLPEGDIVEYGSYKGNFINTLKNLYPLRKITGFDQDNLDNHKKKNI